MQGRRRQEKTRWRRYRDGVQVDDAEEGVVLLLVFDPLADGAEVVAQVEGPRGLHT